MSIIYQNFFDFVAINESFRNNIIFQSITDNIQISTEGFYSLHPYIFHDHVSIRDKFFYHKHDYILSDHISINSHFFFITPIEFTDIVTINIEGFNNHVLSDFITITDSFTGQWAKIMKDQLLVKVDTFTVTYGQRGEIINDNPSIRSFFTYFKVKR